MVSRNLVPKKYLDPYPVVATMPLYTAVLVIMAHNFVKYEQIFKKLLEPAGYLEDNLTQNFGV